MLDILHNKLLRFRKLSWCKGVGLANDGNDVNTGGQSLHEFNIQFTEAATILGFENVMQK
jgi:hypothetical protein